MSHLHSTADEGEVWHHHLSGRTAVFTHLTGWRLIFPHFLLGWFLPLSLTLMSNHSHFGKQEEVEVWVGCSVSTLWASGGAKAVLSVIIRPQEPLRNGFCWHSPSLKIITNPISEAERNFSAIKRIKSCTLNTLTECTGPALHWKPADSAVPGLPKVGLLKGFPTGRTAVPFYSSSELEL